MKSLVILLAACGCALAQVRSYRPVPQTPGQQVAIVRQSQDVNFDGSYQYSFEAENGIAVQEQGQVKNGNTKEPAEDVQGAFQYTAPDGTPISLQYIANEYGFQPQGAHLPVPPPTPPAILRALEWIAAHPEPEEPQRPFRRQ